MAIAPQDPLAAVTKARDLAWAEAFAGLARVAGTLSTRLRQIHETDGDGDGGQVDVTTEAPSRSSAARVRLPKGGFGPRQQEVLGLRGLDTAHGLSAPDVATSLGYSRPNAQNLLKRLEELGVLQRVPDERPARWRRAQD